ncbi:MAG: hypothetical protein CVV47_04215 [Spirochaetae bacterium HGW-Spirochaetae-3]|nr:MAG: hypothetical protein CVV47_04215 [Spirochaetae bacterium HGW-Spirochaetae-3]
MLLPSCIPVDVFLDYRRNGMCLRCLVTLDFGLFEEAILQFLDRNKLFARYAEERAFAGIELFVNQHFSLERRIFLDQRVDAFF